MDVDLFIDDVKDIAHKECVNKPAPPAVGGRYATVKIECGGGTLTLFVERGDRKRVHELIGHLADAANYVDGVTDEQLRAEVAEMLRG